MKNYEKETLLTLLLVKKNIHVFIYSRSLKSNGGNHIIHFVETFSVEDYFFRE